ncbi:MAG: DUF4292 domain-containing protein [Syntrophobacterales bacterium]|nr:DUF4292 domain-containing protein [Syntrophobacterales bacterium]
MARPHYTKNIPIKRALILLVIAGVALSGCAARQQIVSYSTAYDSPEAALRAAGTDIEAGAITATAKIEISDEGKRYPLKAALMIQRPASLRLESIPLIGPPDFFISLTAGEMRIFTPAKGSFYTGAATPHNISKFLHIYVSASELVSLLLGLPPDNEAKEKTRTGRQEENLYRIDQEKNDNGRLSLWIDPAINRIVKTAFAKNGVKIYEAVFEKHLRTEGYYLPQHITITGQTTSALKITYTEIQQLADHDESFTLPIPAGITPIPLD